MTIVFRRDKKTGGWVLFGPASELKPGVVSVSTKSKGSRQETVVSVSKPFTVDGVDHRYGRLAAKDNSTPTTRQDAPAARQRAREITWTP